AERWRPGGASDLRPIKPARPHALVRGCVVQAHGKYLVAAGHDAGFLAAIPKRRCRSVVTGDLIARAIVEGDYHLLVSRNIKNVARNGHRPNEKKMSCRELGRALLRIDGLNSWEAG